MGTIGFWHIVLISYLTALVFIFMILKWIKFFNVDVNQCFIIIFFTNSIKYFIFITTIMITMMVVIGIYYKTKFSLSNFKRKVKFALWDLRRRDKVEIICFTLKYYSKAKGKMSSIFYGFKKLRGWIGLWWSKHYRTKIYW